MRIVIDLQGLQGPNFYGSVAQSQIKFLKVLISNCPSYKIDLLLNGNLLDSAELIKLELSELIQAQNFHIWYPISSVEKLTAQHVWNRQVSELIREALINRLQPDVVLLTSLTKNLSNDIIIASGNFNKNGLTAMIYEITETITQENNQAPETALCYKNEADNLNNIHFSTNLGIGLKYGFMKSFEFNVEPTFKYLLNTFSSDDGNFKPYVFGIYSGVSYKF